MLRVSMILSLLWAGPVSAESLIGGYSAFIGPEDLFNSNGVRLTDAASILRQDRANVHRFGIRHGVEDVDPWFSQPGARAAMAGMFANGGGIPGHVRQLVVGGNVPVYVTVYGNNGNFTSLRVEVPG